jgi:glycine/D-amino acid oxidase-like deaminating enzyme
MADTKGARMGGARSLEHTPVTQILVENGRTACVMTDKGPIRAKTVVV